MTGSDLMRLTGEVVASYVANNAVALRDVGLAIAQVHGALASLARPAAADLAPTPVVSISASVRPAYLLCLQCGERRQSLKRHLRTAHDLTPDQYRARFALPASYPMVSPHYSALRRGLGRQHGWGPGRAARVR